MTPLAGGYVRIKWLKEKKTRDYIMYNELKIK